MRRSVRLRFNMRRGAAFAGLVTIALWLGVPSTSQAAPEGEVSVAENAYATLDFPAALAASESVLAQHGLSHDVLVRATRVSALSHAALGHGEQAKQQFILMLEYDPEFRVDAKNGPRYTEPFAEARGFWQAQVRKAGMDAQAVVQWGQSGEIRTVVRDPLSVVKTVAVGYRWAPERQYTTSETALPTKPVDVPANPGGSSRLEYFVHALDAKGNVVFETGSPESPSSVTVTAPSAGKAQQEKKSFFASPLFFVAGGAVLAAAAVGGFFALRPTDYQTATTARGLVGASCGGSRCD